MTPDAEATNLHFKLLLQKHHHNKLLPSLSFLTPSRPLPATTTVIIFILISTLNITYVLTMPTTTTTPSTTPKAKHWAALGVTEPDK